MRPFCQCNTHHGITHQGNLRRLPIHPGIPVAILRNGGIQQAIPVAVNGSRHPGIGKLRQFQGGCIQHIITLPEPGLTEDRRRNGQSAGLIGILAGGPDFHRVTHDHITHRQHLR